MKNKVFLAILALSLSLSPALVLAETASNTPGYRLVKPLQDIREEYKEKREELKDDIKSATSSDDRKDKVDTIRLERIRTFVLQMQRRLEAALARSQKFIDRINAFLNEREQAGQNVSTVQVKVDEANAVIASSTAKINAIPSQVEAALAASSTPKEIFLNIKNIIGEGVTAVKNTHQKVVEVVRLLMTLSKSDDTATTTDSN